VNSPIIARTSDAYTPCYVVQPGRAPMRSNVMAGRMMTVEDARTEYARGGMVWVATEQEAEAVRGG
jgi:hypothetical protein